MKKDWEIKKLGDVCDIINGKNQKAVEDENGPYPIYGSGGIMGYASEYLCRENTTIIGRKGSINNPLYVEEKFWNVDTAFGFQSKENYIPKLLFYFCKSFDFTTHNKGTTIPSLVKSDLLEINIPVPPLEEQKRIVKILDEKFAQLETIKTNAQTNLQNAKDLFQTQLTKAFSNTSWEKKRLGDFSEITDGDHLPPPKSPRGFPFITISNIDKDSHTINFTDTFYVPETYFANLKENRKPKKGDVLYTVTGSYGIPVIVDGSVEFCFQRHIGLIRPNSEINSNYLYYWILSPEAKKIADDVATGTAQKTVSLSSLRNFEVPLPPLPDQKSIVKELDTLSEKVRQLQEIYTKQIANCADLKQSLLQKAFEGEL